MQRRRELHYEVRFELPPPAVWAILADTERLNQAMGTPFAPYTAVERLDADGRVVRHATKRIGPITLRTNSGAPRFTGDGMLNVLVIFFGTATACRFASAMSTAA